MNDPFCMSGCHNCVAYKHCTLFEQYFAIAIFPQNASYRQNSSRQKSIVLGNTSQETYTLLLLLHTILMATFARCKSKLVALFGPFLLQRYQLHANVYVAHSLAFSQVFRNLFVRHFQLWLVVCHFNKILLLLGRLRREVAHKMRLIYLCWCSVSFVAFICSK